MWITRLDLKGMMSGGLFSDFDLEQRAQENSDGKRHGSIRIALRVGPRVPPPTPVRPYNIDTIAAYRMDGSTDNGGEYCTKSRGILDEPSDKVPNAQRFYLWEFLILTRLTNSGVSSFSHDDG